MNNPGLMLPQRVSGPPVLLDIIADRQGSGVAQIDIAWAGDYEAVFIDLFNVRPATDTQPLEMRTSSDGGATFDAGATDYILRQVGFFAAQTTAVGPAAQLRMSAGPVGNAVDEFAGGSFILPRPFDASIPTQIIGHGGTVGNAGNPGSVQLWGQRNAAGRVDAVRFFFASGNIAEGRFTLTGLRKG